MYTNDILTALNQMVQIGHSLTKTREQSSATWPRYKQILKKKNSTTLCAVKGFAEISVICSL